MDQDAATGAVYLMIAVYFAPTVLALSRGHLSSGSIIAMNVLLGWTLLGWLIALFWSLNGSTRANFPVTMPTPTPKLLDRLVMSRDQYDRTFSRNRALQVSVDVGRGAIEVQPDRRRR